MVHYPHPYVTVSLLDACNKACKHCYRTAIPVGHGFTLSEGEAVASVDDASSLATACLFGGGEPTIWQSDGLDLLQLLIRAGKQHGRTAFVSNGYVFEKSGHAHEFIRGYMDECGQALRMMFSVDFIHDNYDAATESIPFLDSLLAARTACAAEKQVSLFLISHWTNRPEMNIPLHVFRKYEQQGVQYKIDDFMAWGAGSEIADLYCYVEVGSTDKTSLGPYADLLARRMVLQDKIAGEEEFRDLPNAELLERLSVCGRAPNFLISWDRKYYYCIPHMGHDWFAVSEIGGLIPDSWRSFHSARPLIGEIQKLSIFGVLDNYRALIPKRVLDEVYGMRESIRFAGCSICLRLHEEGVLEDVNRSIRDGC